MSNPSWQENRLVADIGGTNARFGLIGKDKYPHEIITIKCKDFHHIGDAIEFYQDHIGKKSITAAAIAVAAPIQSDVIKMTNNPWSFSVNELKNTFAFDALHVINDLMAQALAIPLLSLEDIVKTGGGEAVPNSNIAILGPGTGLGVSGLICSRDAWHPISGEGGHVSFYPTSHRGKQVIEQLYKKFEYVSAERVISGQGLVNLYHALCELDNKPPDKNITPPRITKKAVSRKCPVCVEVLDLFFEMLGTIAGDLALTLGARQGVYIAGGILPKIQESFINSKFRESFAAHGRFRVYLEQIPSYLITYPYTALLGLGSLFRYEED